MKIKARKNLEEEFPDRTFTKEELRKLYSEIEKEGGRQKWLAKKGFIKILKDGTMSVVMFEGIMGKEIVTGIRYRTDIPFSFWQEIGFPQLDRYEFGLNEGKKEDIKSLNEYSEKIVKNKRLL